MNVTRKKLIARPDARISEPESDWLLKAPSEMFTLGTHDLLVEFFLFEK